MKNRGRIQMAGVVGLILLCASAFAAKKNPNPAKKPPAGATFTSIKQAGQEAAFMGDYQAAKKTDAGRPSVVAQVIALGNGEHQANLLAKFDTRDASLAVLTGVVKDGKLIFAEKDGWSGSIENELFTLNSKSKPAVKHTLERTVRLSPTMGKKPPKDALILFDGSNLDEWKIIQKKDNPPVMWEIVEDNAMESRSGSLVSKREFGDHTLHVEFRSPFKPKARGQGRGNSGVYLQGRYEIQVLDSYGLKGENNECGGIYKIAVPLVNMCAPPLQWQTYDIVFKAAIVKDGEIVQQPKVTVRHNGVVIHQDQEVSKAPQASAAKKAAAKGGLYLQDHGNPVRYRNIWVVEN